MRPEPFAIEVHLMRRPDAPEDERWWARAVLHLPLVGAVAGGAVTVAVQAGIGVAATSEAAERQARDDAKGRLLRTAEGM